MSDRHDTITVTLAEPYREEYTETLCRAIELLDGVVDAEPGRVGNIPLHTAKQQLKNELREEFFELLD